MGNFGILPLHREYFSNRAVLEKYVQITRRDLRSKKIRIRMRIRVSKRG
jgi:hypothetical protein